MSSSLILGIDPGLTGAVAVYDSATKDLISVFDMPVMFKDERRTKKFVDGVVLSQVLAEYRAGILGAVIEEVGSAPGQSLERTFNFGYSTGIVTGVILGAGIRLHKTPPSVWKMLMGVNFSKVVSRARAQALFPEQKKLFDRAKDDGRAEAALLAKFGERIFQGDR